MKTGPLDPSPLLTELAATDNPPTELKSYLARLRQSGAIEVYVAKETRSGALIDVSTVEQRGRAPTEGQGGRRARLRR
jgi:hypothetical protein